MTQPQSSARSIPTVARILAFAFALAVTTAGAQPKQPHRVAVVRLPWVSAPRLSFTGDLALAEAQLNSPAGGPDSVAAHSASGSAQTSGKPPTDRVQMTEPDKVWLERLTTWSQAVTQHVPGRVDAPVLTISAWTADELKEVVNDVLVLRGHLTAAAAKTAKRGARVPAPLTLSYRKQLLTLDQLRGFLAFNDAPGADPNRVLKRGAILHADIALVAPVDRSRSTGGDDVVRSVDGRVIGYESHSAHWLIGRQLLDAVEPDPAADPFVRLWYHAIAASLLADGDLAAAEPHLEHAFDVLPEDANIQYEGGLFHQASAAPVVQAAVRVLLEQRSTLRTDFQRRSGVGEHRKEAERRFRLAVTLDPGHVEARMRLGHALLELGRTEDAAVELRRTVGAAPDPTLSYLSALLLGRAEALLGRRDAAVEHYTRAAELFPQAQSAPLALAQLARRHGDRASAWRFIGRVLDPTRLDEPQPDPWWTFYRWQLRSAETLLAELRALGADTMTRNMFVVLALIAGTAVPAGDLVPRSRIAATYSERGIPRPTPTRLPRRGLRPEDVFEVAKRSDAIVYAVATRHGGRSDFLVDLTDATGGSLFEVESTKDLGATFVAVLNEFRQRYLLSYTPHGVAKDGWHSVAVRVKGRNVKVKSRPGYWANK